jgi:hypothetical protein
MTIDPERIAEYRGLVLRVLSTEMTPEIHRAEFEDDIVTFAAKFLEKHDRAWLLAEVRDRRHPFEGRRNLISYMVLLQAELWRELREEDPSMPPHCSE